MLSAVCGDARRTSGSFTYADDILCIFRSSPNGGGGGGGGRLRLLQSVYFGCGMMSCGARVRRGIDGSMPWAPMQRAASSVVYIVDNTDAWEEEDDGI